MDEVKIGMSHQTLVSNVGEAAKFPQYFAALVATLGGFISGNCLGWTSPTNGPLTTNQEYGFPISNDEFAWLSSIMAVGALLAAPVVGWLVEATGRKNTMLLLVFPAVIGWAVIAWAESVAMFCIGRFISGLAGGGYTIVVPLYTNEYSETKIRGTLGTYFQLMLNGGILFTYVFGSIVNVFWLTVLCAIVPIVYGAAMLFLPESPIYYIKTKRIDQARQSLQWFRGKGFDVEPELAVMQMNIEIMENEKVSMLEAFSTTAAKKALVIGLGVMAFQQLSGINAVIFYTTSIFSDAGASLNPSVQTIIVGVVAVVVTYISTLIVDKMGRRPLLLMSDFFMAVCTFFLGLYFFLKTNTSFDVSIISWLPILSVCIYLVMFSIGFGPIPWMFVSEVFPRKIVGYASSLCCMLNWIGVFLVTKFFSDINTTIGTFGSFWLFTIISGIGTVFVYFLVPETKGKTIEEVQVILNGNK
uniref:Major facilitator superfamily (MFS) profile domain-containing protein n=1 Tax=Graphocephala atropunctata TaxID=36148 RepID=A0A1B6MCU6_9HEMI